jgi:methyl-accepting chemotaxis protein
MDELTQQNAALAEQTSAASASLYEKAQEMREMMGFFRMADAAPTHAPTPAVRAPRATATSRAAPPAVPARPSSRPAAVRAKPPSPSTVRGPAPVPADEGDEWEEF